MTLRLVRRWDEFLPKISYRKLPQKRRGIYVLYSRQANNFDVVYIGMASFDMRRRLRSHEKRKKGWTHFSAYEVWPNITREEIRELEGLFRHIYRRDGRANALNRQKRFKALKSLREPALSKWKD